MRIAPGYLPAPQTDYEAKAVAFCRQWLSGQPFFELHTSGSTGLPKSIQLSRRQMAASARLTGQTFGLQADDRALACLNVEYIAGVMMLVRGLELGLDLLVTEPGANPLRVFDTTERFAFAAFVPLQLHTMLDHPDHSLPILNDMKAILVGGAAVDQALADRLQQIKAPVYSTYGMTETVSHIAIRRMNGAERTSVFQILTGVEIGVDERNCLHIRAAATDFETVQTNDVVEVIDETHFRLLGRADSIINSGGVKIQPERIEEIIAGVLSQEQLTMRFFIYGLPDARLGQRVTLFLETRHDWPLRLAETVDRVIRQELGAYAVPKQRICTPAFRETPTGKVDKRAIAHSFQTQ
ncbi:AMP-binding protein [Larkinella harenae]